MNGKDLLTGLSHISRKYIEESEQDMPFIQKEVSTGTRMNIRKPLMLAAILALMLFLMGCAVVVMRLQHLTIQKETTDVPPVTFANGTERNLISVQGYVGSTPYQAFWEWQEFLNTYDTDGSILAVSDDFQKPEEYFSYSCYSQEMVDKLAEICEKYDLEPLSKPWFYDRAEDVFEAVGIKSVFAETAQAEPQGISGYCYKDGSFSLEGDMQLTGNRNELVSFDYRSVQKTSFDGVSRSIGDVNSYDQWNYTMRDGTTVLLALRQDSGLIIVDREDSFVTVAALGVFANGYSFGDVPNERAFLEAFCEAFDFRYQTQPVDPGKADALYQARLERKAKEDHLHVSGSLIDPVYLSSYAGWIDYMVNEQKYQDLEYALVDVNGDGVDELLLRCVNHHKYNGDENSFFSLVTKENGEVRRIMEGGNSFLCKGNVIEIDWGNGHSYSTMDMIAESHFIVTIDYYEQNHQWTRRDAEYHEAVDITEEEAQAIIAQYPRMDIDFKSVEEFPLE